MAGDNFQEREKEGHKGVDGGRHQIKVKVTERTVCSMQLGPSDSMCAAFIAGIKTKYPLTCQPASQIRGSV